MTDTSLLPVAIAVAVAMALAPALRGVTVELNHSVGQVWPFSLNHCHTRSTPGCDAKLVELLAAAQSSPTTFGAR